MDMLIKENENVFFKKKLKIAVKANDVVLKDANEILNAATVIDIGNATREDVGNKIAVVDYSTADDASMTGSFYKMVTNDFFFVVIFYFFPFFGIKHDKHKRFMHRILLTLSEYLFEGTYVNRWKKGQAAWAVQLHGVDMRNVKINSQKHKSFLHSTLSIEVFI